MKPTTTRDTVLDFWRGVSVLLVILHHAVYQHFPIFRQWYAEALAGAAGIGYTLNTILVELSERAGPLGVRFFFIISGYIITKLLIEEEARNGSINATHFYVRRFFRIVPPYLVYIAAVVCAGALGWISVDGKDIVAALTFLCNTEAFNCGLPVIHTWTLGIEQQFYLVWPILFLLVGKKYRTEFLVFTLGILVAFSSMGLLLAHTWIDNALCFGSIALGALFASSAPFRSVITRHGWIISLGALGVVAGLSRVPQLNELAHILYRDITPFILLSILAGSYNLPWFTRSMFVYAIAQVGLVSYSLYLWQQLFLLPPELYLSPSPLTMPVLAVCIAILSYLNIERPAVAWAKRLLAKTTQQQEPV